MELTERYAPWLAWSSRFSLACVVLAYAVYVLGIIPAHVPIERLPELWTLPASEFLERTGVRPGWGWAAFLPSADMLVLAAVALLISSSILCLAAVIPLLRRRGETLFVAICVLQIAVLLLAGSGILSVKPSAHPRQHGAQHRVLQHEMVIEAVEPR